jgi:hypothetical protein
MNKTKLAKKILFVILLCNFVFTTQLYSQNNYKRKISISEWVEEMEKSKGQEYYILEDAEISFDINKDSLYGFWHPKNIKPTDKDKKKEKSISPIVIIRNCKLPESKTCQLRNVVFQSNIMFLNCRGAGQFSFYNCTFKQGFDINHSEFGIMEFSYCSVLQRIIIYELRINAFSFSNCSLYTDHKLVKTPYHYGFEKENQPYQYQFYIYQNEKKINTFSLSNCEILQTDVIPIMFFYGGKYDVIQFSEINFSNTMFNFVKCSVKENFAVEKCKFTLPFGVYRFNFPKDNTSFNWRQLDSVGLGIYWNDPKPYTNKSDKLLSDVDLYNELNSSYQKFFSMYRTQGDIESANACYNQMKDMETERYKYLYKQNPSIKKWFNWRFNQFLKYFSEYGTNPVQSLIISMWVILVFAAVYFFFYSDWDGINRTFLIKQHRKVMQYFRSEQRLEDFYTENYIEDLKNFADYKKEMAEGKVDLPFFITILGKPLYLHSIIKHRILTFLYRRTEVLQGRWIDLKPARKVFVALTVSLSLIIYIIYLVFIRALNSTTLSVNAFSTLGFGAIPVKGISRYITILEGFLGWFLLSIFSVSLISQMLQN